MFLFAALVQADRRGYIVRVSNKPVSPTVTAIQFLVKVLGLRQ